MIRKFLPLVLILILGFTLRYHDLANLPNGLHWDEQDTGYQAYSLLKTGRDYMGNRLPLFLHSFADFRTPVYIYSVVPSVAKFGLTAFAVRLPSVIYALLSILLMYVVGTQVFKSRLAGLIAALTLALSPWHVQYSRQSVETISLLTVCLAGVACFLNSQRKPVSLVFSGLFFGLAIAAYSPGKLFIPLLLTALVFIYFRQLKSVGIRYLVLALVVFSAISAPIILDGIFGRSGLRFRELSIFTDPVLADTVNHKRLDQQISSGVQRVPGLSPRFIDKLVYNKPTLLFSAFAKNYLESFSTSFLFTVGDRELRHSPNQDAYGMLLGVEAAAVLIGLLVLLKTESMQQKIILAWLFLAPISGSLTRWDNPHAARLLIMLPALALLITAGLVYIYKKRKLLFYFYIFGLFLSSLFTYSYFFSIYRKESAPPFQFGFNWAIAEAVTRSKDYDRVIVDFATDSPLMAYLFYTQFDPATFQSLQPLQDAALTDEIRARQFGNLYLLHPGSNAWHDIFRIYPFEGKTLLVVSAKNPSSRKLPEPHKTLYYPDTEPAFYIFDR